MMRVENALTWWIKDGLIGGQSSVLTTFACRRPELFVKSLSRAR